MYIHDSLVQVWKTNKNKLNIELLPEWQIRVRYTKTFIKNINYINVWHTNGINRNRTNNTEYRGVSKCNYVSKYYTDIDIRNLSIINICNTCHCLIKVTNCFIHLMMPNCYCIEVPMESYKAKFWSDYEVNSTRSQIAYWNHSKKVSKATNPRKLLRTETEGRNKTTRKAKI